MAELVGTLRTTTGVDEVDEKVDALRAEMEILAATVGALRTATNDEVDASSRHQQEIAWNAWLPPSEGARC